MAAVSQARKALIEFANDFRPPAAPGVEVTDTPRYRLTLQADYPIPGPNSVSWVRCPSGEVEDMIAEVHATVAPRRVPLLWILDRDTRPRHLGDELARHGVLPEPHSPRAEVMILETASAVDSPEITGIEFHDALATAETFRSADAVNADAFGDDKRETAAQERRRANQLAAGNRRVVLATIAGEPAGSAGLTLFPPDGAILNGGAVLKRFRGRGVYRALVAERMRMARDAGVPGVQVWGGPMSAPILRRLGFETVGWRRFYLDTSTA